MGRVESSRDRLLKAGVLILAASDRHILKHGFTARLIAEEAGLSRRTFYDQFDTIDEYVDALFATLCSAPVSGDRDAAKASLAVTDDDVLLAFRSHLDAVMEEVEQPDYRAATVAGAFGADCTRSALGIRQLVDVMIDAGFEPRSPLSVEDTVRLLASLGDDQRGNRQAMLLLLATLMSDVTDSRDLDQHLEAVYEPMSHQWYERRHPIPIAGLREFVLNAAMAAFRESGVGTTTLDDVGRRVGLSPATLERHVGSISALADQLVTRVLPGLAVELDRDLAADGDGAFANHLARLADLFRSEPILAEIVLVHLPSLDGDVESALAEGVEGLLSLGTAALVSPRRSASEAAPTSRMASGAVAAFTATGAKGDVDIMVRELASVCL